MREQIVQCDPIPVGKVWHIARNVIGHAEATLFLQLQNRRGRKRLGDGRDVVARLIRVRDIQQEQLSYDGGFSGRDWLNSDTFNKFRHAICRISRRTSRFMESPFEVARASLETGAMQCHLKGNHATKLSRPLTAMVVAA